MPRQRLRGLGIHAAGRKVADERMPQGVEVGFAARAVAVGEKAALGRFRCVLGVLVRFQPCFAGVGQVRPEHLGQVLARWHGEYFGRWHLPRNVRRQQRRRLCPQRQRVLPAVLGVGRGNRHARLIAKVEAPPRQAAQLSRPQSGFHRQPVQQRPIRPTHAEPLGRTGRAVQQPAQLIGRQRPPIMPPIRADVHPLQVRQGAFACPAVPHHPLAEALGVTLVIIVARGAHAPHYGFIILAPIRPQAGQERLQLAGGNVAPELEPASADDLAHAIGAEARVGERVPLRQQRRLPVRDMIRQRLARRRPRGAQDSPRRQLVANGRGHGFNVLG
ncbi:MAG TPA: hypothetical protein VIL86_16025 [Tepidisphaeraceae bacterium]